MIPAAALLLAAGPALVPPVGAADPVVPAPKAYLSFVQKLADALRAKDAPPATPADWQARRAELRRQLIAAWGGFPAEPCPLDPQSHGTLKRDGYRVEKVTFQTRPGVRMTANAYVPDRPGKSPAILMVHGHWRGAKQDPVVQSRCVGAAKLGFFVLAVDAFGAGERGVEPALGEYHGDMTAATLLPVGLPLAGLQAYENMRAVDYLRTRPEVDGDRVGVTGASGGGNQSMYAGAVDERLKCVVPVCSVGTYRAYLGAACCLCEVVPGALTFAEEAGLLAMVAPRALLVVSATRDAFQFSVGEARKSVAGAGPVFKLLGKPGHLRHAVFESGHDYSKAMREEMYGWMTLHLKGEGDGSPVREPEVRTENPDDLRCYPAAERPNDWVTIPRFAAAEARKLLAARPQPKTADEWKTRADALRTVLVARSLGGFPEPPKADVTRAPTGHGAGERVTFESEPGVTLTAVVERGNADAPTLVVLNLDGGAAAAASPIAAAARKAGWTVVGLELRATGTRALPTDRVGRAPDHNTAEWGLWVGRPLLGQWVYDLRRLLDALDAKDVVVAGEGPAGLVALAAAATDKRVTKVAAVGTLASYVSDVPYVGQRLGVMAPGILRDVGDVGHLAALAAPKRVVIAGGVGANGKELSGDQLRAAYRPASHVAGLLRAEQELVIVEKADPAAVLAALK